MERYTTLERIHLSYCENVTVPAIFWLLQRLNRLTHLSLTGVPAFRKSELQKMCRPPPKDFNQHQRSAFCVYSGKGVHELRKFLQQHYSEERRVAASAGESTSSAASNASVAGTDGSVDAETLNNLLHPFGPLPPHVQELLANHAQSSENHGSGSRHKSSRPGASSSSRNHHGQGASGSGSRSHRSNHQTTQQQPPAYNTRSHVYMQANSASGGNEDRDAVMTPRDPSSNDDGMTNSYFHQRRNDPQASTSSSSGNRILSFNAPPSSQNQNRITAQLDDLATPPLNGVPSAQSQIEAAQLQYWHQAYGNGNGTGAGGSGSRQ